MLLLRDETTPIGIQLECPDKVPTNYYDSLASDEDVGCQPSLDFSLNSEALLYPSPESSSPSQLGGHLYGLTLRVVTCAMIHNACAQCHNPKKPNSTLSNQRGIRANVLNPILVQGPDRVNESQSYLIPPKCLSANHPASRPAQDCRTVDVR